MGILDKVRENGLGIFAEPEGIVPAPPMKPPSVTPKPRYDGVADARRQIHEQIEAGEQVRCPVCDQNCKLYKRKLNAMQASFLCWLVRRFKSNGGEWIDVPREYDRNIGGEYGKLAHWGLAELKANDEDPSKRTSGQWRPTLRGIDFVNELVTVPKYVYLYDNRLYKVSDEQTTIREALGDKFDYEELMAT